MTSAIFQAPSRDSDGFLACVTSDGLTAKSLGAIAICNGGSRMALLLTTANHQVIIRQPLHVGSMHTHKQRFTKMCVCIERERERDIERENGDKNT